MTTMKRNWGLPWAVAVLAVPTLASAQVTVSDETTDAAVAGRPRATVTLNDRALPSGAPLGLIPEFHTVQTGDTLWDISGNYFENPWYWPRLWARNPQITNPHWIFPGDQVRLLLPGERAAPATTGRVRPGNRLIARPRVPRGTIFLREEAWATTEELRASGSIVGAPEDNMFLSEGDQVYIEFPNRAPNVGESYTVYSEGQETDGGDRDSGHVVRVLGTVVIDAWDGRRKVATGRLTESIDTIERGERVAAIQRQFLPVPPATNDRDIAAHIVATPQPRSIVGGQYVVIVDRGSRDGVRLGNRFFITSRGDPWRRSTSTQGRVARLQELDRDGDGSVDVPPDVDRQRVANELPLEVIGEMTVIAVHERNALCLVTQTQRELENGDSAVMRRGY